MRTLPGLTPSSHEWLALKAYLDARIGGHQAALEKTGLDMDETQFLRGQIDSLRRIIRDVETP